jgi:GNAT superfamily N-acetyltransferase
VRTYRQITEFEPKIAAFLGKHRERFDAPEAPRGLWLCEENGEPVIGLVVYTEPHIRVSVILDDPESRPFASLERLTRTFEKWAKGIGVSHYAVVLPESDPYYCRMIEKRGAIELRRGGGWVEYVHSIDQTPDTSDGIRVWSPRDWKALRPLMTAFLTEHNRAGGDFLPTRNNVETFIRKGVQAATKGDPVLLAYDGGKCIGFVLWCALDAIGLDLAQKVLQGIGTYVVPDHRRAGWSKRLRERAKEMAVAARYTRVDGVALDGRGLAAGKAVGGEVLGAFVRLNLKEKE